MRSTRPRAREDLRHLPQRVEQGDGIQALVLVPVAAVRNVVVADENRRAFSHVVKRCKVKGLNIYAVDKWCVQFGVHPWVVYGDAFFSDIWEGDQGVE